ncbi:MAG: hypothetical protein HY042_07275 [Spirochaetia bacterium]|nr:hypothetical protein [Spirochaetia bacterium]
MQSAEIIRNTILLVACAAAAACQESRDVHLLGQGWELKKGLHPGDRGAAEWMPAAVPDDYFRLPELSGYSGWITLRVRIPGGVLRLAEHGQPLALNAGSPGAARRFYIDGVEFYRYITPDQPEGFHRHALVSVPLPILHPDSRYLEVAMYGNPAEPFLDWSTLSETVQMGAAEVVYANHYNREILNVSLLTVCVMVGLYHLFLFLHRHQESYNLYFGLVSLFCALHWFTIIPTRDIVPLEFDFIRQKIQYASLFVLGPLFWAFMDRLILARYSVITIAGGILCGALSLSLLITNTWTAQGIPLKVWQYFALPAAAYTVGFAAYHAFKGNADAKRLLPAVLLLASVAVHEILRAMAFINTPMMSRYFLVIVILGSASVLARRFMGLFKRVESLNDELLRVNQEMHRADAARESLQWEQEKLRADLHDTLGAKLLDLKHLLKAAPTKQGPSEVWEEIRRTSDDANRILREELLHLEDLRLIRESFAPGLQLMLLRRYAALERSCRFQADDSLSAPLPMARHTLQDTLYPIVQELASNDLKYGIGPAAWQLSRHDGMLEISLKTSSRYTQRPADAGFGTATIKSRIARLGGEIHVIHQDEHFEVVLRVPLQI